MATSKAMREWEAKYADQIKKLATANNVDMGVASDMLQANLQSGGQYKGGGTINSTQANNDLNASKARARAAASPAAKAQAAEVEAKLALTGGIAPTTFATPPVATPTVTPTITPTVTPTVTQDTYYNDYIARLEKTAADKRRAEEQAAQIATKKAVNTAQGYIPKIEKQTEQQMQQAYIAAQRARMYAPQALSAMGYTGGASESALMGIDTDYGNQRNALDLAKNQSLDQVRQNVMDIQASGNAELANLAASYYQQMIQNQREAMSQANSNQRWATEMAQRQAEQAENTRRWNYANPPSTPGYVNYAGTPTATPNPSPAPTDDATGGDYSPARVDTIVRGLEQARAYGATAEDTVRRVYAQLQAGQITEAEARAILTRFGFTL